MRTFTKAFVTNVTHTTWNNNCAQRTANAGRSMKAPHLLPSWNTNNAALFAFLLTRAGVNRSLNGNGGGRFKASAKQRPSWSVVNKAREALTTAQIEWALQEISMRTLSHAFPSVEIMTSCLSPCAPDETKELSCDAERGQCYVVNWRGEEKCC